MIQFPFRFSSASVYPKHEAKSSPCALHFVCFYRWPSQILTFQACPQAPAGRPHKREFCLIYLTSRDRRRDSAIWVFPRVMPWLRHHQQDLQGGILRCYAFHSISPCINARSQHAAMSNIWCLTLDSCPPHSTAISFAIAQALPGPQHQKEALYMESCQLCFSETNRPATLKIVTQNGNRFKFRIGQMCKEWN